MADLNLINIRAEVPIKSFQEILFAMHHSDMFTILDPLEKWKWEQYRTKNDSTFYKFGLVTIKFIYNRYNRGEH